MSPKHDPATLQQPRPKQFSETARVPVALPLHNLPAAGVARRIQDQLRRTILGANARFMCFGPKQTGKPMDAEDCFEPRPL
jgi:hypothetical protein